MRSKLFFPNAAGASVASSFFTIFAGFLARPIGALIFGHIGDRLGRKATLLVTLLLMSTLVRQCSKHCASTGKTFSWLLSPGPANKEPSTSHHIRDLLRDRPYRHGPRLHALRVFLGRCRLGVCHTALWLSVVQVRVDAREGGGKFAPAIGICPPVLNCYTKSLPAFALSSSRCSR
jgi:MFS family permease